MDMDESFYALGFSYFDGIGPKKYLHLLEKFGDAKNAWMASENDLLKVLGKTFGPSFISFRASFNFAKKQEELEKAGAWFVDLSSFEYPSLLKGIPNPPIVLYGLGDKSLLTSFDRKYIGVVGTRRISSYGIEVTEMMVEGLVDNGYCIVSGLAMGVDACAHTSALKNNGRTIAVLGCGVDVCYPRENQRLCERIKNEGSTIVSEYPLGLTPQVGTFPARNRIIAGISASVLATQGAHKSGSLITAANSSSFGRPVFAVPGPITSSLSQGSNELLKSGAVMVSRVGDILKELGDANPPSSRLAGLWRAKGDTKDEQLVIDALMLEELSFDELVKKLLISSSELNTLLSLMELKGYIQRGVNGNFILIT